MTSNSKVVWFLKERSIAQQIVAVRPYILFEKVTLWKRGVHVGKADDGRAVR
jgi:hypothetical protein